MTKPIGLALDIFLIHCFLRDPIQFAATLCSMNGLRLQLVLLGQILGSLIEKEVVRLILSNIENLHFYWKSNFGVKRKIRILRSRFLKTSSFRNIYWI